MSTKTKLKITSAEFSINVPVGSEELHINKAVIKRLLQGSCNLEIADFEIAESAEGRESVVIKFTPNEQ
jgi:hypothetical protein